MCIDKNVGEIRILFCKSSKSINYDIGYSNNKSLSGFYMETLENKVLKVTFINDNYEG